jgi:hypothetical protein
MEKSSKPGPRPKRSRTASTRLENEFGPDIPNSALRESDLPSSEADFDYTWNKFALTFDGYAHWGSTGKCAQIANESAEEFRRSGTLPETLTDLRTCLFFEQRRWHHFGTEIDPQSMAYIKALVASIRTTLQAGPRNGSKK